MPKFRKKPVVVEARRFTVGTWDEQERLADWCGGKLRGMMLDPRDRIIQIQTLEGEMEARGRGLDHPGCEGGALPLQERHL